MGLGPDAVKMGTLDVSKSKEIKEEEEDDAEGTNNGCWIRFRFLGRCISSRSKVDSSISGSSTQDGISHNIFLETLFPFSFLDKV